MPRQFSPGMLSKSADPWLYNALRVVMSTAAQSEASVAAVARGEVPDGSGQPLTPDLTGYFFLAGRPGGQTGYGATEASGRLVLSSTRDATKGKLYLGSSLAQFILDEAQSRYGFNTASPAVTVHIVGSSAGSGGSFTLTGDIDATGTQWIPRGGGAWGGIAGTCAAAMSSDDGNTSMATINFSASGVNPQRCNLSGTIVPGATYTIVLKYLVFSAPYDTGVIGVELVDSTGQRWVSWAGAAGGSEGSGITTVNSPPTFPAPTPTTGTTTVTRTVTCSGAGNSNGTGGVPNSINFYMRLQTGVTDLYGGVTYVTITQTGSDLVRWDFSSGTKSGGIDILGQMGIGTGTASLDSMLTVITGATGTPTLKLKALAAQTADLLQATSSAGVATGGLTAAGSPYLVAGAAVDALLASDASGVGSWQSLVAYEDEMLFYEDSPVFI